MIPPTKPPLSWFLQKEAQTLPPQCCAAMQPFKKLSLRSSCQLFARLRCRPARATASTTSKSPWARVAAVESFLLLSLGHYSAATHAQVGHMVVDSHRFSESLMKGRRALPAAEALTGQKPRQRLPQLLSISFNEMESIFAHRTSNAIKTEGEKRKVASITKNKE